MKLAFRIAWRFLVSSRAQTIWIAVGIGIGIAVQVFIGSLITGLQKSLVDKTVGRSAQVTVTAQGKNGRIEDYAAVAGRMAQAPGVRSVSPAADGSAFAAYSSDTAPILLRGVDVAAADKLYRLSDALVSGKLPGAGEALVGVDLASALGLSAGSRMDILTPQGGKVSAVVSGVYDLQVQSLNKTWVFAPMALAQGAFGYGDTATTIEAQVNDVFKADTVASALATSLPGLAVDNWKAQNASLLSGLNGQSVSSAMIQVFVLVSVVLGIASVLAISVLQKSRQLGILKAMGIKNGSASLIFLFQGLVLGALGAAFGTGLGLGLLLMFTKFALNPDGTPVVPLSVDPVFLVVSGLIGVASATLASLIPARRSARLDPMEVIKNG